MFSVTPMKRPRRGRHAQWTQAVPYGLVLATVILFGGFGSLHKHTVTATTPAMRLASTTAPSTTSAASLYMSNWQNLMAIWNASKLNQNDTGTSGPRIAELRYSGNWSTNQIVDYSGFFRDTTDNTKYDQIHNFASTAYLDENGVMNSAYGTYSGASVPIKVNRDYVMVPNEPFLVVRYTLTNPSATTSYNWNVLDQVHLHNTSTTTNVSATYDATRTALFGDMTGSGQYAITLGAFQSPTTYQAGNDADCTASHATASAWCRRL